MKKIYCFQTLMLLALLALCVNISAQTKTVSWKGKTWTIKLGDAQVQADGTLKLTADANGKAHVVASTGLESSSTPSVQVTYLDKGVANKNIELFVEDKTNLTSLQLGSLWTKARVAGMLWGPALSGQTRPESYAFYDAIDLNNPKSGDNTRTAKQHTVYAGKRADGTVDFRFDGEQRSSSYLYEKMGGNFKFDRANLMYTGAAGETAVFSDIVFGGHSAPSPARFLVAYDDKNSKMSIQSAIDVAAAGDTIGVITGDWNGEIIINKQLYLKGAKFNVSASGRSTSPDPSIETVLYPHTGKAAITITPEAAGTEINGIFIYGGAKGISMEVDPLASTPPIVSGFNVKNCIISSFSETGVSIGKGFSNVKVSQCVLNNGLNGVASLDGNSYVNVSDCTLKGLTGTAIAVSSPEAPMGPNPSSLDAARNVITGGQNGITVGGNAAGNVNYNNISGISQTGISLNTSLPVTVDHNTITNGVDAIYVMADPSRMLESSQFTNNTATGFTGTGLSVYSAGKDNIVLKNTFTGGKKPIVFSGSPDNLQIKENTLSGFSETGVSLDAAYGINTVSGISVLSNKVTGGSNAFELTGKTMSGVIFSGNEFKNYTGIGLIISGDGNHSIGTTEISQNTFLGGTCAIQAINGVFVSLQVKDNTATGFTAIGFNLAGLGGGLMVDNNTLSGGTQGMDVSFAGGEYSSFNTATVMNNKISGFTGLGLNIPANGIITTGTLNIASNTITGGETSVSAGGPVGVLTFDNNNLSDFTGTGAQIYASGSHATFNQNIINGSSQAPGKNAFEVTLSAIKSYYIANCKISNSKGTGLVLSGTRDLTGAPSTPLLCNNTFEQNTIGADVSLDIMSGTDAAHLSDISLNIFKNNGIGLKGVTKYSSIKENTFTGNASYGIKIDGTGLDVASNGSQNNIIEKNLFSGNSSADIYLNGSQPAGTMSTNVFRFNSFGSSAAFNYAGTADVINASGNYWGSVSETNAAAKLAGTGAANFDITPLLGDGTDTNTDKPGFQNSLSSLVVTNILQQTGADPRVKEAMDMVAAGGAVNIALLGNVTEDILIYKNVVLSGANAGIDPNTLTRNTETIIDGHKITVTADGGSIDGFYIKNGAVVAPGQTSGVQITGALSNVKIKNCIFERTNASASQSAIANDVSVNGITVFQNKFTGWVTAASLKNASGEISYNNFDGNATGVSVDASTGIMIHNNTLQNSSSEALKFTSAVSSCGIKDNFFTQNALNITNDNTSGTNLVATLNWWGSTDNAVFTTKFGGAHPAQIDYDPWIGKPEQQKIDDSKRNVPVTYEQAQATVQFTALPVGTDATLTITRSAEPPAEATVPPPANAGTVAPVYLDIQAPALTNTTFNVTITLDVSSIPNFTASTVVMYFSSVSHQWVAVTGVYDPAAKTFTFNTDHFTPFGFVNPPQPLDAAVTVNRMDISKNNFYPKAGIGSAYAKPGDSFDWTATGDDWTNKNPLAVFYVVPAGNQPIMAANFSISWDASKAELVSVDKDDANNLFGSNGVIEVSGSGGTRTIHTANLDPNSNVAPAAGKHLAKLTFKMLAPGYTSINMDNIDFRTYNDVTSGTDGVFITTHPGTVRYYLGDFASASGQTEGDGRVDIWDLNGLSMSYWKKAADNNGYKSKFDIGPTNASGTYWAMPNSDGKIEFEDLVIYSIGYGKSASHLLQKQTEAGIVVAKGDVEAGANEIKIPVNLNGSFSDLRAISMVINTPAELVRVEKAGGLDRESTFLISKQENGKIYVDAAIIGEYNEGLSKEGTILNLVLKGNSSEIAFSDLRARDSYNKPLKISNGIPGGDGKAGLPTEFALEQNYPNPFNPSTVISYQLPKQSMVEISIFNSIGQKVATLMNGELQQPGYYNVTWNAKNMSSGIYFYQIKAGDYVTSKKMMLLK